MTCSHLKKAGIALALVATATGGYFARDIHVGPAAAMASEAPSTPAAPVASAPTAPRPIAQAGPDFSAIVRESGPAVVNISVTGTVKAGVDGSPFGQMDPDDPFFQFFKRFRPPNHGESMKRGLGSGFVVKADGVILTNAHVVAGASEVQVKLNDGREFSAKVVGVDQPTDVAVLKIEAKGLPTVRLGDPSRTQVGEWVLAIGAPFGFENTATAGIVSAKARSLPNEGYVPFLQTDVAVNPGNSGGPLFNTAGEVIGVNSQIYSRSGGYQGLSFAIPIDVAMKVENQLLTHGKVIRGRIGVTIQDVNQALAESFGLPKSSGALISSVEKGAPGARAGLEPGDVILKVNGREVAHSSDLPPMISEMAPGSRAQLEVWRKGAVRPITVTIGDSGGGQVASAKDAKPDQGRLGLLVRPLSPEERQQAGVEGEGGLLVQDVSGPAAKAGVQSGDVVLAINGSPVRNVEQLKGLMARSGKHVALLVQRGEARIFVPINLG